MAKTPALTKAAAKPTAPKAAARPRRAVDRYAPVTGAERGLLKAVDGDGRFDARPLDEAQRIVRPAFLRALLLGRIKGKTVPETGLTALGLIFKAALDLSYISRNGECLPPLRLPAATFELPADFSRACLAELNLGGATAERGIFASRLKTLSHLWLDRLTCAGNLMLIGVDIGGQLSLKGARLKGAVDENDRVVGDALWADLATIRDGAFCGPADGQRFEADGKVRFLGADIGGVLDLSGARLKGAAAENGHIVGDALSFDGATIKGGVFCDPAGEHRFEADGEVRLLNADIGGELNLKGARLKGAVDDKGRIVGDALSFDGATIKGGVFCDSVREHRFEAGGAVRLLGANVSGQLSLQGARLKGAVDNKGRIVGDALSFDSATIKGGVFCGPAGGHPFEADGTVRFVGADVGGHLSLSGARLKGGDDDKGRIVGHALSAEKARIAGPLFLNDGIEIEGFINLFGARLSEVCLGGSFKAATADRQALTFADCEMGRLLLSSGTITGRGQVCLEGAKADNIERIDPALWEVAPDGTNGLELDLDGLTYRRAEFSTARRKRTRKWARFLARDPIAENVLDLLDRSFIGDRPKRDDYRPQPFEQAVKALREAGHGRSANEVAVAKREFHRITRADGWASSLMSGFALVFFRYGYGPLRASAWTIAFVGLGAVAVWWGQSHHLLVAVPDGAQAAETAVKHCAELPVSFALDTLLPLVDLGIDKRCRVDFGAPWGYLAEQIRVAYAVFGWLFIPMVALTFAGVLRKD